MIPFLAYVQVAGMNPLEDIDPNDKGSYANPRLWERILTIAGGPVANYLFASVFFFVVFFFRGSVVFEHQGTPTQLALLRDNAGAIIETRPAFKAGFQDHDRILSVDGEPAATWDDVPKLISKKTDGQPVTVVVGRGDQAEVTLEVVPEIDKGAGKIGIQPDGFERVIKLTAGESAVKALEEPVSVIEGIFKKLS